MRAAGAAVSVVAHDEALVDFIQHHQLNCIRRAVLDAQLAANAFFRIPEQAPAQSFRRGSFLEGIHLSNRALEKRFQQITEHRSNLHSIILRLKAG